MVLMAWHGCGCLIASSTSDWNRLITGVIDEIWSSAGIGSWSNTISVVHNRSLLSWSSPMLFLCICMLMTFRYTASVRRHQSISCRCACRPVLTPLPTGFHQIDCSLTPSRQSSYGAHQLGGRINFLLHHSECAAITWHHLHLFETWEYLTNCLGVLRRSEAVTQHSSFASHSVFLSLIAALELTKLDFVNATLAGIPSFQLDRLQAVINAAARLVFQSSRYDHITSLLQRLHWLCAPKRISYKLAVLLYQCLRGPAPAYLAGALQPVTGLPGRQRLRSSSTSVLAVPLTRLSTIGDREFPVAAAKIWNNLPSELTSSDCLRTFKTKLKTHLFSSSFSQLTVKWQQCHWHFCTLNFFLYFVF